MPVVKPIATKFVLLDWTEELPGQLLTIQMHCSEAQNISGCFRNKDFSTFMSNGFVSAEGVGYTFLRVDDDKIVLAKRKDFGCLTLQASKTAIIIAHTAEGFQFGNVNKGVSVIAEYLESLDM
ncbi:profilin-like isoform X1 [Acropora palmata]|uniref:profilin-like isoform X1 n=1 Tax=Acropora palmata TaxID=6131 RepID=UPI003DA158F4